MASLCQNCGHTLGRADKYCAQCATPVGEVVGALVPPPPAPPSPAPEQWEYCEITWSARGFLTPERSYFLAQNLITGEELAQGLTAFVPYDITLKLDSPSDDESTRMAMQELVQQLLDDGWALMQTSGRDWWSRRFARQVRS